MSTRLSIVLKCPERLLPRVRYTFDTLMAAAAIPVVYAPSAPASGPWILYAASDDVAQQSGGRCIHIPFSTQAWSDLEEGAAPAAAEQRNGVDVVLPSLPSAVSSSASIGFDLPANAFFFLASCAERRTSSAGAANGSRHLFADSVFARLGVAQDVVDRYLQLLRARLSACCEASGRADWTRLCWPDAGRYGVLLSHDVDFVPAGTKDILLQGVKTVARHVLRQRDALDGCRAAAGLVRALAAGRDPYGCLPEMLARERSIDARASYQVAVARRHPNDVNYSVMDDRTRDYLRQIIDQGFELNLHGSFRSTENTDWYVEEAALLKARLARPNGSRQHFLSFDYDALFTAQERAGIAYDMSMGYPDACGPRAGFSYPYFPYDLVNERPYDVVQFSLMLMDVTLRGYLGLQPAAAWPVIEEQLADLASKCGTASIVWHPIVFGGARDPGYDDLYWRIIEHTRDTGGVATDGRTLNAFWRRHAAGYSSFSSSTAVAA